MIYGLRVLQHIDGTKVLQMLVENSKVIVHGGGNSGGAGVETVRLKEWEDIPIVQAPKPVSNFPTKQETCNHGNWQPAKGAQDARVRNCGYCGHAEFQR